MSAKGPIVHSFSAHFIQRWNFVKKVKSLEYSRFPPLVPPPADIMHDTIKPLTDRFTQQVQPFTDRFAHSLHLHHHGSEATFGTGPPGIEAPAAGPPAGGTAAQLCRSATEWSQGVPHEKSIQNAYISLIEHATHFVYIENQFFITATGPGSHPIQNLIGKALVDRILRAAQAGQNFKVIVTIPQVPGFAGDVTGKGAAGTRAIMDYQYKSICRGGSSIMETISKAGYDPHQYISFFNLRSFDRIPYTQQLKDQQTKSGIDSVKADVALGLDLNGLDSFGEGVAVTNLGTGDSLDRVRHKHDNPAPQISPPGKAGMGGLFGWDDKSDDKTKQAQLDKTLSAFTAAGSKTTVKPSIAEAGMMTGANVSDEQWSGDDQEAVKNFVSEEVYIHTKLMIVDDRVVICGSANLNDRSQIGDRDSEIALVVEDPSIIPSTMNGTAWNVSPFASSLRRKLFREHLGLLHPATVSEQTPNNNPLPVMNDYDWGTKEDKMVEDPLSPAFWNIINTTATRNTAIYRDIFHTVPDDNIRTYAEYDKFVTQTAVGHVADYNMPLQYIVNGLSQIRGHIVNMPLHFLENENLIDILHVNDITDRIYL
jgi:phospholipase D1/2